MNIFPTLNLPVNKTGSNPLRLAINSGTSVKVFEVRLQHHHSTAYNFYKPTYNKFNVIVKKKDMCM